MHLASFYDDAVFECFLNMDIGARIGLVGGPEHPVRLHIRQSACGDHVLGLKTRQPFFEILMVSGGAFILLVRFVDGIGGVASHTALDAAAGLLQSMRVMSCFL